MARLDPSLKHAITPPAFDANKLHRERLVDAIHGEIARKLIVIAAPAGYGKTTLLADFAAHTEIPVCWVGLTEADRDVMRLASVLLASLERRFRRLKNILDLRALAGSSPEELAQALVALIDENIDEAFVLMIDEADVINDSEEDRSFFDRFLEYLPDQVSVLAAGREVLEVSLARLMALGSLAGFGPHDLALTKGELSELAVTAFDESLSDADLEMILQETNGWITGIVMSGALGGRSLRSIGLTPRPMVYEYLASVVLNRQQEDIRQFMLNSSVLPVMSEDSCAFVLEEDASAEYLERLVAEGLFVTVTGDSPTTFEYHPLFREFLLETRQASDPKSFAALCQRSAEYLEASGDIESAVKINIMAGDIGRARKLAESRSHELFYAGRHKTLAEWAELFKVHTFPNSHIRLYLAVNELDAGNLDRAEELLGGLFDSSDVQVQQEFLARGAMLLATLAFRRGKDAVADEWLTVATRHNKRAHLNLVEVDSLRFRAMLKLREGEISEALGLSHKAVEAVDRDDEGFRRGTALSTLLTVQLAAGNVVEARKTASDALDVVSSIGSPIPMAIALNNLATIEHSTGQFEEALHHYGQSLERAKLAGSHQYQAQVYLGQADLFNDVGLRYQSAELYGEALAIMSRIGDAGWTQYICVQTSVLHRRNEGFSTAKEWLQRAIDLSQSDTSSPKIAIQMAALEIAASPANARKSLDRVESAYKLEPVDQVLVRFFLSRANLKMGDETKALEELRSALEIAGAMNLEQALAAEFLADRELQDFARDRVKQMATWALIEARISTMKALSEFHGREADTPPSKERELSLTALGQAKIRLRGEEIEELKPQVEELLFLLVDQGGADRDFLTEEFWPDHPPGRRTANLHMAVYGLRNAFGRDFIQLDGVAYSITEDMDIEYDVREFEHAANIAQSLPIGDPRRLFALTESIGLYGGPYLLEFESEWVIQRRRVLEMLYLDLIAQHADEALMRDQPERAIRLLQDALAIDPYRDDLNLRYILLLGRLNRRSALVAHYQRYVSLLSSDLGLDPSKEVMDAYSRMIG